MVVSTWEIRIWAQRLLQAGAEAIAEAMRTRLVQRTARAVPGGGGETAMMKPTCGGKCCCCLFLALWFFLGGMIFLFCEIPRGTSGTSLDLCALLRILRAMVWHATAVHTLTRTLLTHRRDGGGAGRDRVHFLARKRRRLQPSATAATT